LLAGAALSATPAFPGQRGFVGGSMGDDAVIIEGVDIDWLASSFQQIPRLCRITDQWLPRDRDNSCVKPWAKHQGH
jgi:hypothetical protein